MATDKLIELFKEFLIIYKLINRKIITDLLENELKTPRLIKMYELTDGSRSTRDVANIIGEKCSHNTVAITWKRWALVGIVIPTAIKGRPKAAFNLFEYGIITVEDDE